MNKNKIYLDQRGYEDYLNSIENMRINSDRLIVEINKKKYNNESFENIKELIDLSKKLKKRILEKELGLTNIEIIEKKDSEDNIVDLGDIVNLTIFLSEGAENCCYELVGDESDFTTTIPKLSVNSPLGRAMYESTIGSDVYYTCGKKKVKVSILSVEKQKKKVLCIK